MTDLHWREIPWRERRWAVYKLVRQLQPHADTTSIWRTIEVRHGKNVSLGWLTIKLEELEKEGFLRSERKFHHDPARHAARGGRPARYYYPTGKARPIPAKTSGSLSDDFATA